MVQVLGFHDAGAYTKSIEFQGMFLSSSTAVKTKLALCGK